MLHGSPTQHDKRSKDPTSPVILQSKYALDDIGVKNDYNLVRTSKARNTDKENIANIELCMHNKVTSTIRTDC